MQTRELREYLERRGWQLAGEYVDIGISGVKEKRPELDRLLADAHRRRFDVVTVWRFLTLMDNRAVIRPKMNLRSASSVISETGRKRGICVGLGRRFEKRFGIFGLNES